MLKDSTETGERFSRILLLFDIIREIESGTRLRVFDLFFGITPQKKVRENQIHQCGSLQLPTPTPGSVYGEAPQLAELVAAGELAPTDERLPVNPLVIQPVERVGVYGGTWRTAVVGERDLAIFYRTISYEGLLRWDPNWTHPTPNLAQSFQVNEDATTYTFYLREGIRWSDGTPFTADDIMFYYEDVYLNEELTPNKPGWLTLNGKPVQIEKLDDYTVNFHFPEPYGLFPKKLAEIGGSVVLTTYPRHYLEQFHIDFNPDNIDLLVEEAGAESWAELFHLRSLFHINPSLPTTNAWVVEDGSLPGATRVTAVRNPYYWKIDTEFNQLPYIDRVQFMVFDSGDEILPAAITGDINMDCFRSNVLGNLQEYQAGREEGDYSLLRTLSSGSNAVVIGFNQTHNDPDLRAIFQNRDFRVGLSYAIDRQAIIDKVFRGDGEPYQVAPKPESPFYSEQFAKQ